MCCRGAGVACVGVGGPPAAWRAAAALALSVALLMRSAGRGRSEEEVGDVGEDGDEEEVMVFGDVGWAAMRAGAALWAAVTSAAATAWRMEGMSSGCRLGAGCWRGPAATWRPGGPIWSAAVGGGGAGSAVSAFRVRLGWAPAISERVRVGVHGGGNSSCGLHSEPEGWAWGFGGVCGGRVRVTGRWGVPWRVGLLAAGVCGLLGVGGGEGRLAGGSMVSVCG